MNATLTPESIRELSRIVHGLGKFGPDLAFEARRHHLRISAINASRSAFSSVTLYSDKYFDKYTFNSDNELNVESEIRCRASAKVKFFFLQYFD